MACLEKHSSVFVMTWIYENRFGREALWFFALGSVTFDAGDDWCVMSIIYHRGDGCMTPNGEFVVAFCEKLTCYAKYIHLR